jgi:hypothetical protein
MSPQLDLVVGASLAALVGLVIYWMIAYRRADGRILWLVPVIGAAVAVVAVFAPNALTPTPSNVATRGSIDETAAVVFSYVAMLLGMVSEYGYAQAEQGGKTLKFELTTFLMPIFASPIVFIPLLTITSDMAVGGAFTRAKMMVYLVAFQNGFFWKSFFEQRRKELADK